jgi:hypothetical protein
MWALKPGTVRPKRMRNDFGRSDLNEFLVALPDEAEEDLNAVQAIKSSTLLNVKQVVSSCLAGV